MRKLNLFWFHLDVPLLSLLICLVVFQCVSSSTRGRGTSWGFIPSECRTEVPLSAAAHRHIVGLPEEAPFSEPRTRFPHDISISLAHQYTCCTTSGFPRLVQSHRLPALGDWTLQIVVDPQDVTSLKSSRHMQLLTLPVHSCIRSPLISSPILAVCRFTAPRRCGVQPTGNGGQGAVGSAQPAPSRWDVRWCKDVRS